jgi:uncharacterized protein
MLLNQSLSVAEFQELTDFLESDAVPSDAMDICMLDGFLTAIVIGPVFVLPSEWLPRIWGEPEGAAFGSLENAQRITGLVTRFYNQIVRTLMNTPDQFLPAVYAYEEEVELKTSAEEWCIGFGLGVHLRAEAWKPLIEDPEFSGLLAPIVAFSWEPAWNEAIAGGDPDEVREMLIEMLPEAVKAIHQYWLPRREKRPPGIVTENIRLGGSAQRGRKAPREGEKTPKQCSSRPAKK